MLDKWAGHIGDADPGVLLHGKRQSIEPTDTGFTLKMPLPLATKEQIELLQTGDELVVQVGDYKRNVILPRALAILQVAGAKLDGGELRINFVQQKEPSAISPQPSASGVANAES